MRRCFFPLLIALCLLLVTSGVFLAGCTFLNSTPSAPVTPKVTIVPTEQTAAPTTMVTVSPVSTIVPVTPGTTGSVADGAFLTAYADSQAKILSILTSINTETVKNGNMNVSNPDYTALSSYGRQLGGLAASEIQGMQAFRNYEDPANEALRNQYVSYLSALQPFAGNIEAGGGLAQKRQYTVANQYFANAQNDLGVVRNVPLPDQRAIVNQIRTNLGPLQDVLRMQGTGPGP